MTSPGFDYASHAADLEQLRLKIRKVGPASGLHGPEASRADQLLIAVRDQLRNIADHVARRAEQPSKVEPA